ncbi:hypothetical protein N657DRAFT_649750 [Parathielavia appendiculata]|uniref:Uncharacterized protein n=1 Tax=Parathielavia appendiculata TaxID=2587402 RepID=A0AAN6TSD1_9PEZI|nr:hypothetical protein N657DRAFT_649750 [Parathielavia appendiculata]
MPINSMVNQSLFTTLKIQSTALTGNSFFQRISQRSSPCRFQQIVQRACQGLEPAEVRDEI